MEFRTLFLGRFLAGCSAVADPCCEFKAGCCRMDIEGDMINYGRCDESAQLAGAASGLSLKKKKSCAVLI